MILINHSTRHLGLRRNIENHEDKESLSSVPQIATNRTDQYFENNSPSNAPRDQYSEHLSVRSSYLRYLEKNPLHILLRWGRINIPGWHSSGGSHVSDAANFSPGYGFSIATALRRYRPFSLDWTVFLTMNSKGPSINSSIHWNLFWPRLVPWDAKVIDLALRGEIDNMR